MRPRRAATKIPQQRAFLVCSENVSFFYVPEFLTRETPHPLNSVVVDGIITMKYPIPTIMRDKFNVRTTCADADQAFSFFSLPVFEKQGHGVAKLPYSIRLLLETLLRTCDGMHVREEDVLRLANWSETQAKGEAIAFKPSRVLLQDFTGVPVLVDLAAMRDAVSRNGGDPKRINPHIPIDLVIDHSIQVTKAGTDDAIDVNVRKEFERNHERYAFLKWGQQAFDNFRVIPPSTGIVHQVNLEYLARVVSITMVDGERVAFPDTLVGTDSHTTMINGLGVLGWGVGGIEAEAAMLGQPIAMAVPAVVGVELRGSLKEGITATDLVLTITQILRTHGVVGKFVEFFGSGVASLSLADRATIANMAPEYGATVGFFPVDKETIRYLLATGRPHEHVGVVESYFKAQGLFMDENSPVPEYTETITVNLDTVEPCLAGPKRPQDRIPLSHLRENFLHLLGAPLDSGGFAIDEAHIDDRSSISVAGTEETLQHGSVVIAAITSCTNTSNPLVMMAAGLLAKKARDHGLNVPAYVKTSLAPGSRTVSAYLEKAGLLDPLKSLGFNVVGYGCTTCIGNSGPLPDGITHAITTDNLVTAAVLSGNRNFEGRVSPWTKANYITSPPLVIAYAIAGRIDIDLSVDPLGKSSAGKDVYLKDIWPTQAEIESAILGSIDADLFKEKYEHVCRGSEQWQAIPAPNSTQYEWDTASTYIQEPPFFKGVQGQYGDILGARVLVWAGDSVTTDHISPAGTIDSQSAAARYLQEHGVAHKDFNSYGSRRGNHEVMIRGTFANVRFRNLLADGTEGGVTVHVPSGKHMSIYDAALLYAKDNEPLIVLAGKDYGMGSSRDWAAKGPKLLGVRAVIFESIERIHRNNLVGMGILPLQFLKGEYAKGLGLSGHESFDIYGTADGLQPLQELEVIARDVTGNEKRFTVICRIDSPIEIEYWRHGGILPYVLKGMAAEKNIA